MTKTANYVNTVLNIYIYSIYSHEQSL